MDNLQFRWAPPPSNKDCRDIRYNHYISVRRRRRKSENRHAGVPAAYLRRPVSASQGRSVNVIAPLRERFQRRTRLMQPWLRNVPSRRIHGTPPTPLLPRQPPSPPKTSASLKGLNQGQIHHGQSHAFNTSFAEARGSGRGNKQAGP